MKAMLNFHPKSILLLYFSVESLGDTVLRLFVIAVTVFQHPPSARTHYLPPTSRFPSQMQKKPSELGLMLVLAVQIRAQKGSLPFWLVEGHENLMPFSSSGEGLLLHLLNALNAFPRRMVR